MRHTREVGETYLQHLLFACGVGVRLLTSVVFFFMHGFVPGVRIPDKYNLEQTTSFLKEKNNDRILKKRKYEYGENS